MLDTDFITPAKNGVAGGNASKATCKDARNRLPPEPEEA